MRSSERYLNAGFRVLFGETMFRVLHNERLEHPHLTLKKGLSLKEIASRVGYSHTNNFINAFTARYDEPSRRYVE